jgi:fluoroquinolone transport system permease protein
VLLLFSLTRWNGLNLVLVSLFGGMLCVPATLLIVAFANNRVEGMALAKTAGLILLGLPVPFFLKNAAQYLFSPLPSFWIAKLFLESNYWFCLTAAASSLVWIWALYRKFVNKIA